METSGLTSAGEGNARVERGRLGGGSALSVPPQALRFGCDSCFSSLPHALSRTWHRRPTAWRRGQMSLLTGGESGPSGQRAPGPVGEVSNPRRGTA